MFIEGHLMRDPVIGFLSVVLAAGTLFPAAAAETGKLPRKQVGKASVYATSLQGRHMTDGERFNVRSNDAASRTLPIGTRARVTDLETGRSADVTIKDRGPVPRNHIVDLTPHTAQQIGITRKEGVAPVAIVPTSVPAHPTETASRP